MRICLDVDGVCGDFTGRCLELMRQLDPQTPELCHYLHENVTMWDLSELLPKKLREEFWRRTRLPGFCAGILPIGGSIRGVERLRTAGHHVRFVTSPLPKSAHWEEERLDWIARHFGHELHVTFAHEKHGEDGDLLVDDKPKHAEQWAATDRPVVLFDQPYNRLEHLDALPRVTRARTWAELVDLVERLG